MRLKSSLPPSFQRMQEREEPSFPQLSEFVGFRVLLKIFSTMAGGKSFVINYWR
jgi:hypothetical protein